MDGKSQLLAAKLMKAIDVFHAATDPDVSIHAFTVFCAVTAQGGKDVDQGEIQAKLSMSSASASRNIQSLGEVHFLKGKPGYALIERRLDPMDNRRRLVSLTAKGEKLLTALTKALA